MGALFSSPKPPKVEAPPAPDPADTQKALVEKEQVKQLSLARYLARTSGLGANELRGDSGVGMRA